MKRTTRLRNLGFVALVCFLFTSSRAHADTLYFSCGGNIMQLDTISGSISTFASGLSVPWGLALDSSANVYAAMNRFGGAIYKFDTSGTRSVFNSLGGNFQPWYVAFDGSGNLYVSGYLLYTGGMRGCIEKIDTSGHISIVATNLATPRNIAFDKSGNLYVCDLGGTIYTIDAGGNKSVYASGAYASGLAFDSSGNLFTVNWSNGAIEEVDPSGHISVFASSGLPSAVGLTFDTSGNLYVINDRIANQPYTGSIKEFDPSGNGTIVASGLNFPVSFAMLPIPEPATWALLVLGALALLGGRRLRRR